MPEAFGATAEIRQGDALELLRQMPDENVHCVVTSPPYWGLRDYGHEGAWGLEPTLAEYLERMRGLFAEVRRVLRKDGTCWLNMGDAYVANATGSVVDNVSTLEGGKKTQHEASKRPDKEVAGLRAKSLIGLPWRLAFALQDDGWYLRSDIIWHKPNPMPESVRDRPTRAHEYVFLLTKSAKYAYDADAIRTELAESSVVRLAQNIELQEGSHRANGGAKTNGTMKAVGGGKNATSGLRRQADLNANWDAKEAEGGYVGMGANARTVWTIATQPYPEAHFATFPEELPRRCILAGCPPGGLVLDPFAGSGTTLAVALALGRNAIGLELNPQYVDMARKRILGVTPALPMEAA